MTSSSLYLTHRVASFGIRDGDPIDARNLSELEWIGFLGTVRNQRLTGLATAMSEDDHLITTEAQADALHESQRAAMIGALSLERTLLRIGAALDEANVGFVVLKCPALANTFYPDPSWRPFGDLDLLVHTNDFSNASEILHAEGFARRLPEPRPGWDRDFGKAALHADADDVQIDLHRTLVVGPFGLWIDLDDLFAGSASFEVGGRSFKRLPDPPLFLHACMHASLGWRPPLILPIRDVAQIALYGQIDWDEVEQLARRWRLGGVLRHSARTLARTLEIPAPTGLACAYQRVTPTRLELHALAAYTTDRRRRGGTSLLTLAAIPGVRARLRYIIDLVFPRRSFLAARTRDGERPSYLRRWKRPLQWLHGAHR
ncbi:MAG: nucleotidyltransferase family protein [Actinomycetota bacterium]